MSVCGEVWRPKNGELQLWIAVAELVWPDRGTEGRDRMRERRKERAVSQGWHGGERDGPKVGYVKGGRGG